jgi:hypothetical protein
MLDSPQLSDCPRREGLKLLLHESTAAEVDKTAQ